MDAVDPHVIEHIEETVVELVEVKAIQQVRARWLGHQLLVDLVVAISGSSSIAESQALRQRLHERINQVLERPVELLVEFVPTT